MKKYLILLLVIVNLGLGVQSFSAMTKEEKTKLEKQIDDAYEKKDNKKMVNLITKYVNEFPNNADYLNRLGVLYTNQKNYSEAEKWYLKAVDKGSLVAVSNLAYVYIELEDYEKAIILDEKQKTVLKLILIILCWAFWYYAEEYYSFNEYCFGTIDDSNACLDFLNEFKDWYAKENNDLDYDILKRSKTNPLYSEVVETIIDSYKEAMNNWKTDMRLKLKIDVPYQVNDKTYFVEKAIVVEQSFVNKKRNKFFEFSLETDSDKDSLLHWWNTFYFGTTKATKKSDLEKFFLNLVDERFNLKKDEN